MEYRVLGKTGYRVSALGFGAMNLPGVPFEQASEALNYALDQGINYIDTAAAYRNSEEIIGKAIAHRRDEYFLATKTAVRDYDGAKAEMERSLQRLQMDYLDLMQIHYVNHPHEIKQVMAEDGAYKAAKELQAAGKIRFIGITGHRPELTTKWLQSYEFDQILFHLNLGQPFALDELIPEASKQNLARIAMKPFSGGYFHPVDKAIRFPYSQDIHVVLSGMTSVSDVKSNLEAMAHPLQPEERGELADIAKSLGTHNCRRCNYCSCPIGIRIPDVMITSVARNKFGLLPAGHAFYEAQKDKLFACEDHEPCQTKPICEQQCPYDLPIKSMIKHSHSFFDGEATKGR